MAQLNAIGIVSADLARSRTFYGLQLRDPDGVGVDVYAAL